MRTKAAVLYAPHTEYVIEEIELDPPKASEVLVKFAASRHVPLRRAHGHRRHGHGPRHRRDARLAAVPDHRRPRGRRRRGRGRPRRHRASPSATTSSSRSSRLRPLPARAPAASRTSATTAPTCSSGRSGRRHQPPPTLDGQDIATMCCARHLRRALGGERELGREGRARPPARQGLPASAAASPPAGARPSTPPTSQPGDNVAVIGVGGLGMNAVQGARSPAPARHRHRPGRVQAGAGPGVRRHPHRRLASRRPGAESAS